MTKMDELGKRGWASFSKHYQMIWSHYMRYGDRVIEVEFEEGEEEVKNIFLEAKDEKTLLEEVTALWIKKYQIIINSCADIEKVYSELTDKKEVIYIYPEEERLKSPTGRFYITLKFFLDIYVPGDDTYVFINECVYEIRTIGREGIQIKKKIPIASMLKDE